MPESAIPPYITSLIRHFEDLRDGRHGGSATRNKSRADLSNPIIEECCQSIQLYLAVGPLTRKLYRSETDRYRQVGFSSSIAQLTLSAFAGTNSVGRIWSRLITKNPIFN